MQTLTSLSSGKPDSFSSSFLTITGRGGCDSCRGVCCWLARPGVAEPYAINEEGMGASAVPVVGAMDLALVPFVFEAGFHLICRRRRLSPMNWCGLLDWYSWQALCGAFAVPPGDDGEAGYSRALLFSQQLGAAPAADLAADLPEPATFEPVAV